MQYVMRHAERRVPVLRFSGKNNYSYKVSEDAVTPACISCSF